MVSPRLLAAAPLLAAGCTIVLDVDDLRQRDAAEIDAIPIDAMPIDADPSRLAVTGVEPAEVLEGTGGDGGRPALFVIEGDSITGGAIVTAELLATAAPDPDAGVGGDAIALTVEEFAAAPTGRLAAVAVRIPVLEELAAGAERTLRLTFTQGDAVQAIDVTVQGLAELELTGGNVSSALHGEDKLWSRITVTGATHFTGTTPVFLRATGDVRIAEVLDVDAVGQTAGPHGCRGGDGRTAGDCGSGGGRPGGDQELLGNGDGGGGGGFATEGGNGEGGAAGGAFSGNPMLVPIVTAAGPGNRGNGGGGGGTGGLVGSTPGGAGGGGGGVIELRAGGDIEVTGAGAVRARGGNGGGSGGGGGGGSGGAILVRAGGAITSGTWLSAPGGNGADAASNGGNGAPGRIRVDAPAGGATTLGADPVPVAGPAWVDPERWIVGDRDVTLTLRGTGTHGITVNDDVVDDVTVGLGGTASVALTLDDGRNTICAIYTASAQAQNLERPEATSCIDIIVAR